MAAMPEAMSHCQLVWMKVVTASAGSTATAIWRSTVVKSLERPLSWTTAARWSSSWPECFGVICHSQVVGVGPATIWESELRGVMVKSALVRVTFICGVTGVRADWMGWAGCWGIAAWRVERATSLEPMRAVTLMVWLSFIWAGGL